VQKSGVKPDAVSICNITQKCTTNLCESFDFTAINALKTAEHYGEKGAKILQKYDVAQAFIPNSTMRAIKVFFRTQNDQF